MRTRRWTYLALVAVVLTAFAATQARAADPEKPPPALTAEQKALDLKLRKDLFAVINRGCDYYDARNVVACYYLYEGAIRTVEPLLDHHPKLQKAIADGLKEAEGLDGLEPIFRLRKVLDAIRDELKNEAPGAPGAPVMSLWEKLGAEKGVTKIVHDFVDLAAKDAKVNFDRGGKYKLDPAAQLKLNLHTIQLISAATGGPHKYTGKDMKEVHKDMAITDEEFDAALVDLGQALVLNKVSDADAKELLRIVGAMRRDVVTAKKPVETPAKTQWDRLGGEKGVGTIVDDLMATVAKDPDIRLFPNPNVQPSADHLKKVREEIIDYISSKTGGPRKYEGKTMKEAHAGMKITEKQFDAFLADFDSALKANKVKDDDVKALLDAVKATKKDIVEAKKPDEKKSDDKKPTDK